ncbi:MAG: prephenate dehydratase [Methanothermococcus sp.]|jgi:prephenate dehydratase|nr:prephenate dehydratase [Methanothermococcus sp.]MDK2988242.1 prephenate dehydratase [Methanothermococcus sp.]
MKKMIYTLGPKGSYSEKAAKIFSSLIHKKQDEFQNTPISEQDGDIIYCGSIYEVFECVEKNKNTYGVVPSENSIEGSVTLTQDLLLEFPVKIVGEVDITINHCLIGYNKDRIKKVLSHPQALAQCRKYIKKHGWEVQAVSSTAKAVKTVFESKNHELGAIGSKETAKIYDLKILDEHIQDYPNNKTRFILIGSDESNFDFNLESTIQKSTVILELKEDKPGSLYNILKEFYERNINLTRIESRPSKKKLGSYIFYIDFEHGLNENYILNILDTLDNHLSNIKYLGNYGVFNEEGVN